MKKYFYFLLIIWLGLSSLIVFGQPPKNIPNTLKINGNFIKDGFFNNCGTDKMHQNKMRSDPDYAYRYEEMITYTQKKYLHTLEKRRNGNDNNRSGTIYTIPVVVHVMHLPGTPIGTDENISDVMVHQGIQDLNDAFRNVGFYNPSTGVDTEIEFCLALRDTNGQPSTGITRSATTLSNLDKSIDDQTLKDIVRWNTLKYMNIWLVNEICAGSECSAAGYAYYASAHGEPYDGIVNEARWFGSSQDYSKVHVHEAGHYLDLDHTWGGFCPNNDCTADGDRVCDTPPDNSANNIPCGNTENSCNTDEDDTTLNNPFRPVAMGGLGDQNDMIENYMDYSFQQCQDRFTQGQKDRMQIVLTGIRASLLSSDGCSPAAVPLTNFYSASRIVCVGSTILFNDSSLNGPTSWSWVFENGTPSSSIDKNPSITYNTPGIFDVSLLTSNSLGNGTTEAKPDYILVYPEIPLPACAISTKDLISDFYMGIFNVTLQNINNTSGGAKADGGYRDFSCSVIDTLTAGNSYPISITLGDYNYENLRVYLDFNNDGIFNNTSELIFSLDSVKNVNTGSFFISNISVKNTKIRMRVISDWIYSNYTGINGCDTVQTGQAEDYGIVIKCFDDTGLPPISNFTSDKSFGCPGTIINFIDNSQKCPGSWSWAFNGGNPTSSSSQNPTSTFNYSGKFQIDLTASNSYGTGTKVSKSSFIKIYDPPVSACTPVTIDLVNTFELGIRNVSFQNIKSTTGSAKSDSGYLDFSCSILDTLRAGNSYPITITTNSVFTENLKVYIDWNADGALDSTDEMVFNSPKTLTIHSGNIMVPTTSVKEKILRMRVISEWDPKEIAPCNDLQYGQAEDYGLIVKCAAIMQAGISVNDASCSTCADGKATVSVSGGISPYSYLWNDSLQQTTPDANGLKPGIYTVVISDSNNCELIIESVLVGNLQCSLQAITNINNASCSTCADGKAIVSISGGTPPYSYLWNDILQQLTSEANGLIPGIYSVTISDSNNCELIIDSILVSYPPCLLNGNTSINDASCSACADGKAAVSVSGGTPPYSYLWNDSLKQTTLEAIELYPGIYSVIISDSNNCEFIIDSILVSYPTGLLKENASNKKLIIFPNPNFGTFIIILNELRSEKVTINIFNTLGEIVFTDTEKNFKTYFQKKVNLGTNFQGVYLVQVITDLENISKVVMME